MLRGNKMTIEELKSKDECSKYNWNEMKTCSFEDLKNNTLLLKFPGIYILTDNENDVVYIGSAYVRFLRKRLLQYQQAPNTGNASLRQDLVDAEKATEENVCDYIKGLTIMLLRTIQQNIYLFVIVMEW
jgi:hypothetical protein